MKTLLFTGLLAAVLMGCRSGNKAPPTTYKADAAPYIQDERDEEIHSGHRDVSWTRMKDFGTKLLENMTGKTPFQAAKKMESTYFADERRAGINDLVERTYGKRDPYTKRYAQIAQYDSDWLVRATAIRALNRSRDRTYLDVVVKALGDENTMVRQEAAKALGNMPDDSAIPGLIKVANNEAEDRDARIAAADALRHYRRLDVGRALINNLKSRDFGVAWQSHETLYHLTGHNYGYDDSAWLDFITGPVKPFG